MNIWQTVVVHEIFSSVVVYNFNLIRLVINSANGRPFDGGDSWIEGVFCFLKAEHVPIRGYSHKTLIRTSGPTGERDSGKGSAVTTKPETTEL